SDCAGGRRIIQELQHLVFVWGAIGTRTANFRGRQIMKRHFCNLATGAVAIIFATLFGQTAWSQTAKTIKIIVPFPAGGVGDTLARMLADQIGRAQGALMVVENRAGAGSAIGTEAAARAAPDGNTVLITSNSHRLRRFHCEPDHARLSQPRRRASMRRRG